MAAPDKVYRDYITRRHRTMALYLAMMAWAKGLDCVVVNRNEIVRFWGLTRRVEDQRLDWLKEDVTQFFPYIMPLYSAKGSEKFASVFLSRRPFPPEAFYGSITDEKRSAALTAGGLPTSPVKLPTEMDMLALITATMHGLGTISP